MFSFWSRCLLLNLAHLKCLLPYSISFIGRNFLNLEILSFVVRCSLLVSALVRSFLLIYTRGRQREDLLLDKHKLGYIIKDRRQSVTQ